MRRFASFLLASTVLCISTASAQAQVIPSADTSATHAESSAASSPGLLSPGTLSLSADAPARPARPLLDPELPLLQLRHYTPGARKGGRWMVMIGAALAAGGGLIVATMGQRQCYDDHADMSAPRISGGVTLGVGLAFTLAGSIWLGASEPGRPDQRRNHIINHVFGSILFAAITSSVLWAANLGSFFRCVNS